MSGWRILGNPYTLVNRVILKVISPDAVMRSLIFGAYNDLKRQNSDIFMNSTTLDFKQEATAFSDDLIRVRRDLHRHPELGFQETRTAAIVAEALTGLGLEVQAGVGQTGVVALLEGARPGPASSHGRGGGGWPVGRSQPVVAAAYPGGAGAAGWGVGLGAADGRRAGAQAAAEPPGAA